MARTTRQPAFRRKPAGSLHPETTALDYAAHFHHAPSGYLVLDPEGTILEANETLAAWVRRRREKMIGTSVLDLLPGADRVFFSSFVVPQLAVAGAINEVALDLLPKDGESLPVLLSAVRSPLAGDGGTVDRVTFVRASERLLHERDLTAALRKAEAAEAARAEVEAGLREKLWELEEKNRTLQENLAEAIAGKAVLETVFHTADVGLLLVDPQGNTVLANDHLVSTWRTVMGDVPMAEEGLQVFSSDRRTPLPEAENPTVLAAAGKTFSDQLLWFGSGDNQIAVSVSARPAKTNGALSGSVVAFHDVTRLARAVAAQEDFLAGMSHELRTPLTSITGYLDLVLEDSRLPQHLAGALNVAVRNSERLLAVLSEMMPPAAEAAKAQSRPVDLAEAVRAGIASLRSNPAARHVDFLTEIPVSTVAEADPEKMKQVVGHLLSNAVKYSLDGGTVYVQMWQQGRTVSLRIADTGTAGQGLEPEKPAAKLFTARRSHGAADTASGIAASKGIVREHGGELTYVNTPGEGSVYTVTLPVSAEVAALNR